MANRYKQVFMDDDTRFSQAVTGELAFSRFRPAPMHLTTFNAGDIVPIYCGEVLPHDTWSMDLQFVIRQTTTLVPTMGNMYVDFYAFFVPNRVVNHSWQTVMGENPNGVWSVTPIDLAPLYVAGSSGGNTSPATVQINVGSVADYYGFPTQEPLPTEVLAACHDLKFRGYIEIYNQFFRDQNYQPPVPYSKLNVYEDFLGLSTSSYVLGEIAGTPAASMPGAQNNDVGAPAIAQSVFGNMQPIAMKGSGGASSAVSPVLARTAYDYSGSGSSATYTPYFNANAAPLKANKLHDYFTSVLPSPQRGESPLIPLSGLAPVYSLASRSVPYVGNVSGTVAPSTPSGYTMASAMVYPHATYSANLWLKNNGSLQVENQTSAPSPAPTSQPASITYFQNLWADLSGSSSATIAELRTAAAVQRAYEELGRCGGRYREFVRSFFGLDVDDPYKDIPEYLGHFRRQLDLYQTAQTSASSESGDGTPQGTLAAFGYTANSGKLFTKTFLEHGYVHVMAVVRQKNVYPSYMGRDNFRTSFLDFYLPQLANISEQPVFTREINPFYSSPEQVFGYQEAWAEYRYEPDRVSGQMRPMATEPAANSLAQWNYADKFNSSISVATAAWLKSNAQEVLQRTLAVEDVPQFLGQFQFVIDKERPMPTYSLPGLDIF